MQHLSLVLFFIRLIVLFEVDELKSLMNDNEKGIFDYTEGKKVIGKIIIVQKHL
jgi:hypothetical protein